MQKERKCNKLYFLIPISIKTKSARENTYPNTPEWNSCRYAMQSDYFDQLTLITGKTGTKNIENAKK